MSEYRAPLKDIRFTLNHICDLQGLCALPGMDEADPEVIDAALEEAGRLAAEVLAPLNQPGDLQGSVLENGVVRTPDGFAAAYAEYRDGGWNSLPFEPAYGGMGMPALIGNVCTELWNSANMGWALCPLLNQGAVEAISAHGSDGQKQRYLPKLISGEWTGTMNLTEPQAGSDVGALRTRAEPAADGTWRIRGQKIFISYGEHDFAENIVHLVLARTPGSPEGTKGISLFIVPKFLVNEDGTPGERNDLRCVSLEHKMGIHASPTCVMSYGDDGGAVGYMLGGENQGMRCMFTMMNAARLGVGIQGLAVAERAYQRAVAYANERRQGRAIGTGGPEASPIVEHADVRRMLMTMKANVDAMRAICYYNAQSLDLAHRHPEAEQREHCGRLVELLTPLSKAWCTDTGCEVASLGMQVHGGMGFIEETGAAQHLRDVRITPIYEGTNGIQAMDLVMRKLPMAGGEVVRDFLSEARDFAGELAAAGEEFAGTAASLSAAIETTGQAGDWLLSAMASDANAAAAGCMPYLRMLSLTTGGYLLARGALAARHMLDDGEGDAAHLSARIATARFFAEQILPQAPALLPAATAGSAPLYEVGADAFAA